MGHDAVVRRRVGGNAASRKALARKFQSHAGPSHRVCPYCPNCEVYGRFTSIRDIDSVAMTFRFGAKPAY